MVSLTREIDRTVTPRWWKGEFMVMPRKTGYSSSEGRVVSDSFSFLSVSSTDPEIKNIIEPLGYSEKKMLEGKKLYESVRNMQNTLNIIQRWRHSEQKRLVEAKDAAFQTIQDLLRGAKTSGPPDCSNVNMKDLPVSAFLSCAYAVLRVIENSAESAAEAVQSNQAAARRKLDRSKILTLDNANLTVASANSSVTKARAELDEATSAFRAWFGQYRAMIMVALRGKKKLLDKLGLSARPRHGIIDEAIVFHG
jgi:hypothetical protein